MAVTEWDRRGQVNVCLMKMCVCVDCSYCTAAKITLRRKWERGLVKRWKGIAARFRATSGRPAKGESRKCFYWSAGASLRLVITLREIIGWVHPAACQWAMRQAPQLVSAWWISKLSEVDELFLKMSSSSPYRGKMGWRQDRTFWDLFLNFRT